MHMFTPNNDKYDKLHSLEEHATAIPRERNLPWQDHPVGP